MESEDITFKACSQQPMSLRQGIVLRAYNLSEQHHVLGPAFKHMSLWDRCFSFKSLHILRCSVTVKAAWCLPCQWRKNRWAFHSRVRCVTWHVVDFIKWYQVEGQAAFPFLHEAETSSSDKHWQTGGSCFVEKEHWPFLKLIFKVSRKVAFCEYPKEVVGLLLYSRQSFGDHFCFVACSFWVAGLSV